MSRGAVIAVLALALLALAAGARYNDLRAAPKLVNLDTYTNITIEGATRVIGVSGAVVDFNFTSRGAVHVGLKPLPGASRVVVSTDAGSVVLPVAGVCRIKLSNFTRGIYVNSTCREVVIYANGSRLQGAPQYSGIYSVLATNGTFYERAAVVVVPEVRVSGNVFGEIMTLVLEPPPRGGIVLVGGIAVPASRALRVDTWGLGAGNHTVMLNFSGVVITSQVTVQRARPEVVLAHRREYIYGDDVEIAVSVRVRGREYKSPVSVLVNGTPSRVVAPGVVRLQRPDAGAYSIVAEVTGDRNITSASASSAIRVAPAPVILRVRINGREAGLYEARYGELLEISVELLSPSRARPAGVIAMYLDGRPQGSIVDTLAAGPGPHNLTVAFIPSSRNFASAGASAIIYVAPSTPTVETGGLVVITYGQELAVPIRVTLHNRPVNITVLVSIVGLDRLHSVNKTVSIVNGEGVLRVAGLPAGVYLATVTVPEAAGIVSVRESFRVVVRKAPVAVIVQAPGRSVYGSRVPILAAVRPRGINGTLTVTVNGTALFSGSASLYRGEWEPPRGGAYTVAARFESLDPNYSSAENTTQVLVERAPCAVRFAIRGDVAPGDAVYVLRRYAVEPLVDLPVRVVINGSAVPREFVLNSTGAYNVTVYFPGDERYYPCWDSKLVTALRNPAVVRLSAQRRIVLIESGLVTTVEIESPVGHESGEVVIRKINRTFNCSEADTVRVLKSRSVILNFSCTGVYNIVAEFKGNEYLVPNVSNAVTVMVEGSYFGVPAFLLYVYLSSLAIGFAAAFVVRRILKRAV